MSYSEVINFIKNIYGKQDFIPLHPPVFLGNEKKYLNDCIDSTFVSSVGKYVDKFEELLQSFTGANKAVAVSNGTSALHTALSLLGISHEDEVITQALTFVATCNAISYTGASPVFVDVDKDTMGLSPEALDIYLNDYCEMRNHTTYNKTTGKRVSACIPMHTFGNPLRIKEVVDICNIWNISVVEDAAESLGSYVGNTHTGLFGKIGVLSFNGNKTITTGGGGAIITNDLVLGTQAKHITTTAKAPHKWEFNHDMVGFNYRMPNINAALGCAQLEKIDEILKNKRNLANKYQDFFKNNTDFTFVGERVGCVSNFWLNSIIAKNIDARDHFLAETNDSNVMTRPVWTLMTKLPMYRNCSRGDLTNSVYLEERIINIPSGVIL